MRTRLAEELGLEVPIFAFSKSPQVVAAVSRAGGMGVLGALAYTLDQLKEGLDFIEKNAGGRPFGVDVVMPASILTEDAGDLGGAAGAEERTGYASMLPERHKAFVADLLHRYRVPELPEGEAAWHGLLAWTEEQARAQVEIALSRPVKLLANALGPPPRDIVEAAHARGIKVAALTGSVRHSAKHIENGVDIIVAQGTEAGGHCGEISTMVLVPDIVDAVRPAPVLAAGGIGSGRQIAAALALGAEGVWTGSIWLTAEESDVISPLKEKLLRAGAGDTVRSRALTGKPARQLRTSWSEEWSKPENPDPLPMPLQFLLTAEATSRIHRHAELGSKGAQELVTSPVGQIVGRMNAVRPVHEIMEELVRDFDAAARRMRELSGR